MSDHEMPDPDGTEWFTTLPGLHAGMWQCLTDGVARRTAPARHPALGTVDPAGLPAVRTVVLRAADAAAGNVDVHTDLYSSKVAHLRLMPHVALHVWDDSLRLQIRLSASVTILTGAEVAHIWDRVPDPARQSYGTLPAPGTPITAALDYVKSPDAATFAVLRCRIETADLVHLGDRHRRARFDRDDLWAGQWLSP